MTRDATVCGHVRSARAEHVRERGGARPELGQRFSLGSRAEERRALVAWRHDELGGEPGLVRPGGRQQLGRQV